MDEEEVRLRQVFDAEEIPEVDDASLKTFARHLQTNLAPSVDVTGREDFPWEEFYVFGPGEPEEYDELKKSRPSYRDKFVLLRVLDEPSPSDDLVASVERLNDGKRFEIDLSWLEAVDETSEDARLLDDFASWQVNWQ